MTFLMNGDGNHFYLSKNRRWIKKLFFAKFKSEKIVN